MIHENRPVVSDMDVVFLIIYEGIYIRLER